MAILGNSCGRQRFLAAGPSRPGSSRPCEVIACRCLEGANASLTITTYQRYDPEKRLGAFSKTSRNPRFCGSPTVDRIPTALAFAFGCSRSWWRLWHSRIGTGFEHHISISKQLRNGAGTRCDSDEANWVLDSVRQRRVEEDNHVPRGIVRKFWRPGADRLLGIECPRKAEEPATREDMGDFVWRPAGD
jgi:hypothetical protein